MATLVELLHIVERLTPLFKRSRQGRRFRPCAAQIVYFTLLALKQKGMALPDDPAWQLFSQEVVVVFRDEALRIAGRLAAEYPRVQKLLRDLQGVGLEAALERLHSWILKTPLFHAPALPQEAHLAGVRRTAQAEWQQRWRKQLEEAWVESRYLLYFNVVRHVLLPVVVFPEPPEERALEALRERLTLDRLQGWAPTAETFLFQEPFDQWLVRPLLTGEMLLRVCQALGAQAAALAGIIQQEILQAALEAGISAPAASDLPGAVLPGAVRELYRRLPRARRRALPLPPTRIPTAQMIFDFAVMGWRQAQPTARATTVRGDRQRLDPRAFQQLVQKAQAALVFLMWDDAADLRVLHPSSPAFWKALRRAALPESLWPRYQRWLELSQRLPPLTPPPHLAAWEEALGFYARRLKTRLEASPAPGEPLTGQVLQRRAYLYDRPFWAWCREALSSRLPDFGVVAEYCLELARAQGAWPGEETPGAPHSAEEAGRMIAWYTKLTIEMLLSKGALAELGIRLERSLFCSPAFPQRADGGLTLWIGQPVPAAALELARVVAPVIAHCISQQARDPLGFLPYALQDESHPAWAKIRRMLLARARALGYAEYKAEAEVERVVAQVVEQLSRLLLPQSITPALLRGERVPLAKYGLLIDNGRYTTYTINYRFTSPLLSYILRCLRPAEQGPAALSLEHLLAERGEEQGQPPLGSAPLEVEEAVLQRAAAPPLLALAEERYGQALAEAIQEVLRLMLQADLSSSVRLPDDLRARLFRRQRLVLAHGLLMHPAGRCLVDQRREQGDPLALEAQQLAELELPEDDSLYHSGCMMPRVLDRARPAEVMVLLAQLLAHPQVRQTPALRKTIALLFDLPSSLEAPDQPAVYCLARLERVGPGALVPALREVRVHALESLRRLASRERKAVVLRLFRLADVRLTLALLERTGWVAPRWLLLDAELPGSLAEQEAEEVLDVYRTLGEEFNLPDVPGERRQMRAWLTGQLIEPISPQIFQEGRARWHGLLAASLDPLDQAAAGLVAEWLGLGFWDEPWLRPRTEAQARAAGYLFQTLLAALPMTLRLRWREARRLTTEPEHALGWSEFLGLAGCLGDQLPLALEDPAFLHWLAWRLFKRFLARLTPAEARRMAFPTRLPDEVCAALREGRRRFAALFLALGQLAEEGERRVVLAALSVAQGQPERFGAWLAGAGIDRQASAEISAIVHLGHHRIALDAAQVPVLFAQASRDGRLKEAWRALGAAER